MLKTQIISSTLLTIINSHDFLRTWTNRLLFYEKIHGYFMTSVFKFGGTSMGSIERIEHVADLCLKLKPLAVVVSAMSGETNRLVALGHKVYERTDVPEYDMLVASGEQVSVALLSLALRKRGIVPAPMLAQHAGIQTDSQFSRASILKINASMIQEPIQRNYLPVIAGFQGVTEDGQLTSLGRGGSDTSAVAIAAAIGAKECVIYTDVDGVYSTDPRICPRAHIVRKINYDEMLEMASQGSKVLHIRSVQLAAKWGVKLIVRNTFTQDEGTEMTIEPCSVEPKNETAQTKSEQRKSACPTDSAIEGEVVVGIAGTKEEAWIQIGPYRSTKNQPEFSLAQVFSALAEKSINVDIINQNEEPNGIKMNFTVALHDAQRACTALKEMYPDLNMKLRDDVAKISIVGMGMRTHAGVAARMFRTLARDSIEILLVTTSEIKVGCLILRDKLTQATNALHTEFLE